MERTKQHTGPAIDLSFAHTEIPRPSLAWRNASVGERYLLTTAALGTADYADGIEIIRTMPNGHIILSLTKPMTAAQRGARLLELEGRLKRFVEPGLTVWLEPKGDRNTLRHLRGIEVKG